MVEQNSHWTENEENVDRFLMGRLSGEERSLFLSHLEQCGECRERIARARHTAAQIREAGRRELKSRLSDRIKSRPARIPWPHVLSAAAVVIVVIGVGLYAVLRENRSLTVEEHEVMTAEPPKKLQPDQSVADQAQEEQQAVESTQGRQAGKARSAAKSEFAKPKGLKKVSPPPSAAVPAERPMAQAEVSGAGEQQEFWLEGTIVAAGSSIELNALRRDAEAAPRMMEKGFQKAQKDEDRLAQEGGQSHEVVTVQQLPSHRLPVVQQQQFMGAGPKRIPTKFEQTDNGMVLTIYTDQVLRRKEDVQLWSPSNDSLIVEVDGLRIAYRVPASLQRSIRQTAPAK